MIDEYYFIFTLRHSCTIFLVLKIASSSVCFSFALLGIKILSPILLLIYDCDFHRAFCAFKASYFHFFFA